MQKANVILHFQQALRLSLMIYWNSVIKRSKERPADTFQACNLHGLRGGTPKADEFIEHRVRTSYGLGTAQRRWKGRMEL